MKKTYLLIIPFITGLLFSCGDLESTSFSTSDEISISPSESVSVSPEINGNVVFWNSFGDATNDNLLKVTEEFNEVYPNVKVNSIPVGGMGDLSYKLTSDNLLPSPSLVLTDSEVLGKIENRELFIDLKEDLPNDDYFPCLIEEVTSYNLDNRVLSIPYSIMPDVMFMAKKNIPASLSDELSNIVPSIWEDEDNPNNYNAIINYARKILSISENQSDPVIYISTGTKLIQYLATQQGINLFGTHYDENGDIQRDITFVNDDFINLLVKLKHWFDEGLFITNSLTPIPSENKAVFNIETISGYMYEPCIDATIEKIPSYNEYHFSLYDNRGLSVTKKASLNDQIASIEFAKFISKHTIDIHQEYSFLPTQKSAYAAPDYTEKIDQTPLGKVYDFGKNKMELTYIKPFNDFKVSTSKLDEVLTDVCLMDISSLSESEFKEQVHTIILNASTSLQS